MLGPWLAGLLAATTTTPENTDLPNLMVTGRVIVAATNGVSIVSAQQLEQRAARHPQELFTSVPGAWISRGSGQEHLTAIRSPVLTGAGACGAFLVLEDHIPLRPAGFCNVNQLFEVNLRQAAEVRVLRGPGLAQHGANALHGTIDVASPTATDDAVFLEFGSQDYRRAGVNLGLGNLNLAGNFTESGSFRRDEDYRHTLINLRHAGSLGDAAIVNTLSFADLDQETAGFVVGENAFRDDALRRSNGNPEAFRDAYALRAASHWQWQDGAGTAIRLSPYFRHSKMDFLQHFLPGQPVEENSHTSGGIQFNLGGGRLGQNLGVGGHLEVFHGHLREFQHGPVENGSAFLTATRPAGLHYDYGVTGGSVALWARQQWRLGSGLLLEAGLRGEWLYYDYDNRTLTGNTRDDGSVCGFGGCLFSRPADRADDFFNLAPALNLSGPWMDSSRWRLRLARGYRPPQATELYRLQNEQAVADLNSETLDSIAVGIEGGGRLRYSIEGFFQRKRDAILRDAEGLNISDGKTRHVGVEWSLEMTLAPEWSVQTVGSYALHRYRFDRQAALGETIRSGNDVDTAPRRQGSAILNWRPRAHTAVSVRVDYLGAYYLDAANTARYGGHTLLNVDARLPLGKQWHAAFRARNLLGKRYAERADFAFGRFRYFPGEGRSLFVELGWRDGRGE